MEVCKILKMVQVKWARFTRFHKMVEWKRVTDKHEPKNSGCKMDDVVIIGRFLKFWWWALWAMNDIFNTIYSLENKRLNLIKTNKS
jgi:hypothetical protein